MRPNSAELMLVDVILDGEQHLIGIDGLDDVIGDFRTDGFVHDILLFAFGNHDYGGGGTHLLDLGKRFETRHAGHHFVEDDQVIGAVADHVDRIVTVVAGIDVISFLPQEKYMRFQQFDFIIDP